MKKGIKVAIAVWMAMITIAVLVLAVLSIFGIIRFIDPGDWFIVALVYSCFLFYLSR